MNNINNIPVEDYIPDLVGTSADGKSLDMILKDRDEIIAWYKLIEPEMPRVCPECFRLIDDIELISPRVELPIDSESVPLAMTECQAVCPYCNKIIHREYAEFGYPFDSAVFVQKTILKQLRASRRKAGEKNG